MDEQPTLWDDGLALNECWPVLTPDAPDEWSDPPSDDDDASALRALLDPDDFPISLADGLGGFI